MRWWLILVLVGCGPPGADDDDSQPADDDDSAADDDDSGAVDDDDSAPADLALRPFLDGPTLAFGFGGWPAGEHPIHTEDRTNGGGGALVDLDGDGDLDLALTSPLGDNRVFLNDGGAAFVDAGPSGLTQALWSSSLTAADLDGDGLPELLLGAGHQLLLHRNLGGSFELLGPAVELPEDERVEGAVAADLDGDGDVDLYVSVHGRHLNEQPFPQPFTPADRLLEGTGSFTFEDRSDLLPVQPRRGQSYVAALIDVDEDGDLDILSVKDRGERLEPNALFLNPGDFGSAWPEAAEAWALDLAVDGMGVAAGDLGNDGSTQITVTDNQGLLHTLTLTEGSAVRNADGLGLVAYEPEHQESSWGPAYADLDGDGDLDAVVAFGPVVAGMDVRDHRNGLWEWVDGRFVGRPDLLDAELLPPSTASRCPLVGDLNGDGAPDLVWLRQLGAPRVQLGQPNDARWLRVHLEGPPGNRGGLGARVEVDAGGVTQWRTVASGHRGVHSSGPLGPVFGLGTAEAQRIEVFWPDGTTTVGQGAGDVSLTWTP